ncbi:uncharacterized protein LOC141826661 [Curcuma longa]|uniref:uncharacterized protein LOC141826661 n=1 Tax=Curcuma longa TaxID=136217 RepID=UPI003D9F189F
MKHVAVHVYHATWTATWISCNSPHPSSSRSQNPETLSLFAETLSLLRRKRKAPLPPPPTNAPSFSDERLCPFPLRRNLSLLRRSPRRSLLLRRTLPFPSSPKPFLSFADLCAAPSSSDVGFLRFSPSSSRSGKIKPNRNPRLFLSAPKTPLPSPPSPGISAVSSSSSFARNLRASSSDERRNSRRSSFARNLRVATELTAVAVASEVEGMNRESNVSQLVVTAAAASSHFAGVAADTESELDVAATAASSHFDAFVVDFEVESDAVAYGSVAVADS